jgi:succinate dehydrogenase / fumarate reductase cytochrome b subunit
LNWLQRSWLFRVAATTVGQKVLMGLTGLGLCGFLVVHLAGNLLLYRGQHHFNEYARKLHEWELLPLLEVGLFGLFVLHLLLALTTSARNRAARPVEYAVQESKLPPGLLVLQPHNFMLLTGFVVLAFLLLHLSDLRFHAVLRRVPVSEGATAAEHALAVLRDPLSAGMYVVGSLFIGLHVWHGFQSGFRSIGFHHPKYTPALRMLSAVLAVVLGLGFASLPIWFNFNPPRP